MALYWYVQNTLANKYTGFQCLGENFQAFSNRHIIRGAWTRLDAFVFFSIYKIDDPTNRGYLIKHLGIETSKVGKTFENHEFSCHLELKKNDGKQWGKHDMHFKTIHMSNPKIVRMMELLVASFTFHVSRLQCFDTWWIQCFLHLENDIPEIIQVWDLELNKNALAYSHWEVNVSNDWIVMKISAALQHHQNQASMLWRPIFHIYFFMYMYICRFTTDSPYRL